MKAFLSFIFLVIGFSCQQKPIDEPSPVPENSSTITKPAILEAEVEGVGKALITNQQIIIKLPVTYKKNTVRITYKVTNDVKLIRPASGTELPVRDVPSRFICIQQDALGNCTLFYKLIIEVQSPLRVFADPASMQLTINQFQQPFQLTFRVANLKATSASIQNFQVRFVNKATQYTYTAWNSLLYDSAGKAIFNDQLNQATLPDEAQLRMYTSIPLGMTPGDYTVTIQAPTCYEPIPDGGCSAFGYESVELATPFVLKAGKPVLRVDWFNPVPDRNRTIQILGQNLAPTTKVVVKLMSDFAQPFVKQATIINDTLAKVVLPTGLPDGQYMMDVEFENDKVGRTLFRTLSDKAFISYAAPLGTLAKTYSWLPPALPYFRRGDTLEVSYSVTTIAYGNKPVKQLRLVSLGNERLTYTLQEEGSFNPFPAAGVHLVFWKWRIPSTIPTGAYKLLFDGMDANESLPYYERIDIVP